METPINERKDIFEKHIKPKLIYVGSIGAFLMVIAYIVVVFVLIFGFKVKSIQQSAIFAIVNGIVGFIIMQFLKVQGIDFAKSIPENEEIIKTYYSNKTKDKKVHSLKYYWTTSVFKEFLSKALSIMVATGGLIYIVIEGTQDYSLLLLALVNLIMFICFGLLSLVSAYDFFNNTYVPYMLEKIEEVAEKKQIEEIKIKEAINAENSEGQSDNSVEESSGTSSTK